MTLQALAYIKGRLTDAGLNYHLGRYDYGNGSPKYPYHVGEYSEDDAVNEDGGQQTTLTIHSWARGAGAAVALEQDRAKIRSLFPPVGGDRAILDGSGVVVTYGRSQYIPTGDSELKRLETTIIINEWSEA